MSKLLDFIAQFEQAGAKNESLVLFLEANKEEVHRLQLIVSLFAYVDCHGYENLEGSFDEGYAKYLHYDGIREVTFAYPGVTSIHFGPVKLTPAQVRKFKTHLRREEKSGDESWREELDEDEAKALMIYEAGGEAGKEYYHLDTGIEEARETERHISDQIDETPATETWDSLSLEELEELAKKFPVEHISVDALPEYFELIREYNQ